MTQKTVFISYRRSLSKHLARSIYQDLKMNGWDVFLDVNTIDSGDFDQIILNQIGARAHFVLLISPGSLERCQNADDWVLREIQEAIQLERNIIPIIEEGADFNRELSVLPAELSAVLSKKNALPLPHFFFDAAMQMLRDRFLKTPEYITVTTPSPIENMEVQRRMADTTTGIHAFLPAPFEWCEVPAGEFIYQDKQMVMLPAFSIAKYPITYQQFQTFIDAEGGFKDPRWWEGLSTSTNESPAEQYWKINNHPSENRSWYDAIAFCRWLSFKLGGGYALNSIDEWKVRLPTDFEWEKAARGTDGRQYPWGNGFDVNRCNTKASGLGKTTPVTQYPSGASPYGVMDMSGNIWEWSLSDYKNPQVDPKQETFSAPMRILRGGSWSNSESDTQTTLRNFFVAYLRLNIFGFRIVRND